MSAISGERPARRGRELFRVARPFLRAVAAALRVVPDGVVEGALVLCRHVPTRLGVALRYALVARLAARCGDCVAVFDGAHLFALARARFGDHVSIHPMCYVDATGGLEVGSHVSIAHGATIVTTNHDAAALDATIRDAAAIRAPVVIGTNVWIGAGARVLAGVTIGDHVVIGAGAVVTRDVPSHSLAVGVPARVVKTLASETTDGARSAVRSSVLPRSAGKALLAQGL